jgi:hypothetical protein
MDTKCKVCAADLGLIGDKKASNIAKHSKIYPDRDFSFENMPSGNHGGD